MIRWTCHMTQILINYYLNPDHLNKSVDLLHLYPSTTDYKY